MVKMDSLIFNAEGLMLKDKVIDINYNKAQQKKATITAAIIAKDEEKNIGRMLASIKDVVDEIIVVDTGSSDNTNEIAKNYGAKIFSHLWEDDFSKARNQSLSYATKQWVLIIDCDEELYCENVGNLKVMLGQLPEEIGTVTIELQDMRAGIIKTRMPGTLRFFRTGEVHYEGTVHNNPIYEGDKAFYPDAYLKHYGYDLDKDGIVKKTNRTIRLLKERLRKNNKDYSAYFYLSQSYGWIGNHKKSVSYAEKYLKHKSEIEDWNVFDSVYFTLATGYMTLNNLPMADKHIKEGLRRNPNDIDLLWALVLLSIKAKNNNLKNLAAANYVAAYAKNGDEKYINENINSKFVFSYNPENYAFCISLLAMDSISQSAAYLSVLHEMLPALNDIMRVNIAKDIAELQDKLISVFDQTKNTKNQDAVETA